MEHLYPYIPIGMVFVFAAGFGVANIVIGRLIGPQRPNPSKNLPYESGIVPTGEANVRVPIKFYMVAILFLLFDIETIFILAWAVVFRGNHFDFDSPVVGFTQKQFQVFAMAEMSVFMVILLAGYAYVWMKGGFRWS